MSRIDNLWRKADRHYLGDGHKKEDGVCSNCRRYGQPCHYGTPVNALVSLYVTQCTHADLMTGPSPPVPTEVGNESVNHCSRALGRRSLAYCMLCTQVHRGSTAAHHKCGESHKTSESRDHGALQSAVVDLSLIITQYAPDQDLSDLLEDIPTPNPLSPGESNLIFPSRFFLPSGERVEAYPSYGIQDSEALLTANPMRSERGEHYGSTSVYRLVEFALEYRDGAKCEPTSFDYRFPNRRPEFWEVQDVSSLFRLCNP